MVVVMPCDSSTGNLELGAGRFVHGNLFALGRGMIPLEISGSVIGVNVDLSSQGKVGISDLIVLMSFYVFKRRRSRESLESGVDLFQNMPSSARVAVE
jgi:hypothetical protein